MVWPEALPFWEAYWTLAGGRQISVGLGAVVEQPIQFSEIVAYGAVTPGMQPGTTAFRVLVRCISAMDRKHRDLMAKARASASQGGKR